MKKRLILLTVTLLTAALLLCACSPKNIVGTWKFDELGEEYAMQYTFTQDGQYSFYNGEESIEGSYEYNNGKIFLDGEDCTEYLKIDGDTITMRVDLEDEVWEFKFIKQK